MANAGFIRNAVRPLRGTHSRAYSATMPLSLTTLLHLA